MMKKRFKLICKTCKKEFEVIESRINNAKFCSNKCKRLSDNTKKNISSTIKNNYKNGYINPKGGKGKHWKLSEENKRNISEGRKKLFLKQGFLHSKETRKKISNTVKKYAKEHKQEYREKAKSTLKKLGKSKVSKAELVLKKYFDDNNIEYIHQFEYKYGIADFYLPKKNLIVECNGIFWHNLPNYIERDKIKYKWLKDNKYNILILCSEDITDNKIILSSYSFK